MIVTPVFRSIHVILRRTVQGTAPLQAIVLHERYDRLSYCSSIYKHTPYAPNDYVRKLDQSRQGIWPVTVALKP